MFCRFWKSKFDSIWHLVSEMFYVNVSTDQQKQKSTFQISRPMYLCKLKLIKYFYTIKVLQLHYSYIKLHHDPSPSIKNLYLGILNRKLHGNWIGNKIRIKRSCCQSFRGWAGSISNVCSTLSMSKFHSQNLQNNGYNIFDFKGNLNPSLNQ